MFLSFLVIILMLSSFNFFSISFSKNNVRNEVIKYNTNNLNHTTDSYEKHFDLVKTTLIHFYFTDHVQLLKNNQANRNYAIAYETQRDIVALLSNPLLHINNLTLHAKEDAFILDKHTSSKAETYFSKFYYSEHYPLSFWQEQFHEEFTAKLLPAAPFYEIGVDGSSRRLGTYMPFLVKNVFQDNFYMIAFLDADHMFRTFHNSINDHFHILDAGGNLIFSSGPTTHHIPSSSFEGAFNKIGANYYFFKTGAVTGNTYINIIPDSSITEHQRMSATLISLLLVSVIISLLVSFLFSVRLNQPIQRIVESIQHFQDSVPYRSRIKEIDLISRGIMRMKQIHRNIHQDLDKKNTLLKYYAYTSRLKNIRSHFNELKDMVLSKSPFVFILFEMTMKSPYAGQRELKERWVNIVREYIGENIAQRFPDSLTFQIEENQVLSIVSLGEGRLGHLRETLERMKQVFDLDRGQSFVTICVSSIYDNSLELNDAYDQVLELKKRRSFTSDSEIIDPQKERIEDYHKLTWKENEFDLNLRKGNRKEIIDIVNRALQHMEKKNAPAEYFYAFSEEVINKVLRTLHWFQVRTDALGDPMRKLQECFDVQDLKGFFQAFLERSAALIAEQMSATDPITEFVMDYIEKQYAEDITLELVAAQLNLSGGYLSTYFKEKTGKNFIDYVHEVRIAKAKELLKSSNLKVQEIARKSGYHNMNSFHRMFKKYTGLTPSEYRRMPESPISVH